MSLFLVNSRGPAAPAPRLIDSRGTERGGRPACETRATAGALALVALVGVLSAVVEASAGCDPSIPPIGSLDVADGTLIAGWARDDDYTGAIAVHVYVDDVLVHALSASNCRPDVGCHAFAWTHPPFGEGRHKVVAYAIGVDALGRPDGNNRPLDGTPKHFDVGCAGLTGAALEWCEDLPNYWVDRQRDTTLLMNGSVTVGINNSYGGAITQLYDAAKDHNLIGEHGGAAVQLSIWGGQDTEARAWLSVDPGCDPTRYPSEQACLQKPHAKCAYVPDGAHVCDCVTVNVCNNWSAAGPWNPIQAIGEGCLWDDGGNDVDEALATASGGWFTRLTDPFNYGKTNSFDGMSFLQTVELGDVYAKVTYEIQYSGQYTTAPQGQEIPALFTAPGVSDEFYFYAGSEPYDDPGSPVTAITPTPMNFNLALPQARRYPEPLEVHDHATEHWWGTCGQDGAHCVTAATFSDPALVVAMRRHEDGSGYLTPLGLFDIHPGMNPTIVTYLFPYRYDRVVEGKTIRQRIYEICSGGSPSCDDGNSCTVDSCHPTTGCTHTPSASCMAALISAVTTVLEPQ